jgi:hypothetical protein
MLTNATEFFLFNVLLTVPIYDGHNTLRFTRPTDQFPNYNTNRNQFHSNPTSCQLT